MESISELREKLQGEKVTPKGGWKRPWGYKTFQRGPSIYITRALINTRIEPNQVTIAGLFIGFLGVGFVMQPEWYFKLLGLLFIYLHILSDKVDGELARYHNKHSLRGVYWDEINHLVIPPLFWFGLAFGVAPLSIFLDVGGLFFGVSMIGAIALAANRVIHSLAPQIYAKKYMKDPERFNQPEAPQSISEDKQALEAFGHLRIFIRIINQFQDFFVIIATTGFIIILERLIKPDHIFHPLLTYYILIMSLLFVLFSIENAIRKSSSIEQDIKARS